MDMREEVAILIKNARLDLALNPETTPQDLMLAAILRFLNAIDEDLQKLRKELRTRNGGEDA